MVSLGALVVLWAAIGLAQRLGLFLQMLTTFQVHFA